MEERMLTDRGATIVKEGIESTGMVLRDLDEWKVELYSAIGAKYGEYLSYGEGVMVELERQREFVRLGVVVEDEEETSRVEWEVVRLKASDGEVGDLDEYVLVVLDYLDELMEEYFTNDRFMHFNDDWREEQYRGHSLRMRSSYRRPQLDRLADAWLDANGDPGEVDGVEGKYE